MLMTNSPHYYAPLSSTYQHSKQGSEPLYYPLTVHFLFTSAIPLAPHPYGATQSIIATLEDYLGPLAAKLPKPNYVDPETRVPILLGMEVSIIVLMSVFLFARFYTRIVITRNLGWDDVTMGLAAAIAVAQAIALCLGTKYGLAYHLWDIRPQNIPMAFKMMATGIVLSYLAAALCKISVCMGYLKLFPLETNRRFCYMMMIYSGLFGITAFFMSLFVCTPVTLTWNNPFSPKRKCVNISAVYIAIAALNSLGDILIFLWPALFLYKLPVSFKSRLGLITLFYVGCCIVAISVCRIIWLLPVARTSIDFLYSQSRNIIAASVETNLGIICGCLPLVKAFLTHFSRISSPTIRHSTTAKGGGNAYQPQESSSRKHYYSRSRTDLAFNFTCPSRKDSNGYELRAVDSSCDTDERRLVTDIEVVPVPRTIKAHEFVVRTSPLNYENSVTGVADSPCENAR